jgi:hypothetical protein
MPNVYLQDKKLSLEFPDGMTEQQIQDAIEKEFYPDAYQQRLLEKSTEDEPMLNRPLLKKDDGTVRVAGKDESVAMQAMKDLGIDKDLSAMAQGKPPADHFEGQRNALDGGLHEQVEAGNVRKDLKAEAINRKGYDALSDMVIGAANVASSTAKGIDAFFGSDTARAMADQIDAFSQQIAPDDPAFIDAVFQGIGSTALFLLPGLAVTGIVNKARAGLKLAQVLGTTTMAAFEGLGEAGSVFDDKIKAGATRQEALRAATWTFLLNLPLNAVTDHFAFFLGDEGASVLKEIVRGGFNESLQEFLQGVISGSMTKAPQVKEMGWDYYRNVPQEQVTMDFSAISQGDWGKILKGAGMEGLAASVSGGMFGGAGKIFADRQATNDEKEDLENFSKDNRSLTDLLARQNMSPSGENLLEKEANLGKEPKTLAEFLEIHRRLSEFGGRKRPSRHRKPRNEGEGDGRARN